MGKPGYFQERMARLCIIRLADAGVVTSQQSSLLDKSDR